MKAVIINQFGSPDVLEYVDISKPIPQAGEVLVKNVAIGAWKPDCLVRSGHYPYLKKQPPMLTIGNECAGYVEAVGEGVTDFKPGMPVWVVHMTNAMLLYFLKQYLLILPLVWAVIQLLILC